jgi:hypothetical protein
MRQVVATRNFERVKHRICDYDSKSCEFESSTLPEAACVFHRRSEATADAVICWCRAVCFRRSGAQSS